jgi:hypothetical protein
MPMVNQYLEDLGFDMFTDLFDIQPKFTKSEIFEQFENNLKVINKMSLKDLHDFYVLNIKRIEHNFINLVENHRNSNFKKIVEFINKRTKSII